MLQNGMRTLKTSNSWERKFMYHCLTHRNKQGVFQALRLDLRPWKGHGASHHIPSSPGTNLSGEEPLAWNKSWSGEWGESQMEAPCDQSFLSLPRVVPQLNTHTDAKGLDWRPWAHAGAGEPELPLLKGAGRLRRGCPSGDSSLPSQRRGWELVTTQELLGHRNVDYLPVDGY